MTAIDRDGLPVADQLNYDLYRDMIASAIDGLEFENDALPLRSVIPRNLLAPMNQLEGAQQDIPRVISLMPATRVAGYDDLVKRLESVPALVDQTIALMQRGLAVGATPPKITFRDVPSQVQAQIVADPLASPLLAALKAFPASIPTADRDRLTAAATMVYSNAVRPAFVRLHDFLIKTYLPGCRDTIAVAATSKGAAQYAYNVRWHTTTAQTPQQIHDIGLAEVTRIRGEMDAVMRRVTWDGTFEGFKQYLRTNPPSSTRAREPGGRLSRRREAGRSRTGEAVRDAPAHAVRRREDGRRERAFADYGVLRTGRARGRTAREHARQHLQARRAADLGDGGADAARGGAGAPSSDLASAQELEGLPDFSEDSELHGVRRGLGALFGKPRRGDGVLYATRTRSSGS